MGTVDLYGAGGHGKVVMDILRASGIEVGCFFDDTPKVKYIEGIPVRHASAAIENGGTIIVTVGDNSIRKKIVERLGRNVEGFGKAVHPSAVVSPQAQIGYGTMVIHGAIIQTGVAVGRHCIVNTGAILDHDCNIGDYVHIGPGATLCGNVTVGDESFIGAGTTVTPGVKIGKRVVIGAGSVVLNDVPDGNVAYGNPARIQKPK